MTERRRRSDSVAIAAVVVALAALAVAGGGLLVGLKAIGDVDRSNITKIAREANERRDQTCVIFETNQLEDIRQLRRTYDFLSRPPRSRLERQLQTLTLGFLPETERDARIDDAPPYCDAPNVGLPEPDLPMPVRPDLP